ncbi:hypothetical protein PILCRDRAFT_69665, partial [Piloderma croceum F 1598]
IGLPHRMSQSVMHGEVESGQVEGPPSLAAVEFLRSHEVLQVLVIHPDFKLVMRAFQKMAPIFQSSDDRQHFLVVDLIVPLHGIETFGVVSNWMPLLILRGLFGKVGAISLNLEGSGLIWEHQNWSGDHASPNGLKCCFLHFPPLPCGVLPCKVKHWAGEVQESLNEAAVEIGKAQEGLNLLVVWCWPLCYSSNFHGVHLRLSMGDDKSEVFNLGLCELALVMLEIEFVLLELFQY